MRTPPHRTAGAAVRFALVLVLVAAIAPAAGAAAAAQGGAIPPAPERWVTDRAGFLSPATVSEIDARLEAFERETGHQVLLYIDRTTGDVPLEDAAARAFAAWKAGRRGLDDGLVLFIFSEDRRVRIEVGYGLEELVPDAVAGRVINDLLVPVLERGDADAAVRAAVGALLEAISGRAGPAEPAGGGSTPESVPPVVLIIGAILFLILFITNPRLALWLLFSIMSGGRGGGGGGGFSGGGGRSGGGGASGRW